MLNRIGIILIIIKMLYLMKIQFLNFIKNRKPKYVFKSNKISEKKIKKYTKISDKFLKNYSGDKNDIYTLSNNFKNVKNNGSSFFNSAEYTYYRLQKNAENYLPIILKHNHINEKINSLLAAKFIQAEINEINNFEKRANELLLNKTIRIDSVVRNLKYEREIEYLRIKSGYYKNYYLHNVDSDNATVIVFAEYVLLKEYLQTKIIEMNPQNTTSKLTDILSAFNKCIEKIEINFDKLTNYIQKTYRSNENINLSAKKSKQVRIS